MNPQPSPTQGIVCALWTPLTENGAIDYPTLDRHLDWLGSTGLHGYLIWGSTGRFVGMPTADREALTAHVLPRISGFPSLVNVSHLDPRRVARLGSHARECGAGGVTVLPPWFYEQAQADLVEWFVAAGEAARLPLWLYNYPERTGNRIDPGTVQDVQTRVSLGGFKNSGANQELLRELARLANLKPFALFAGADSRIPEAIALGAVGCIGGLANVVPEAMLKVYDASAAGDLGPVENELILLREISLRLHLVPFPINIAAAMEARGLRPGAIPSTMSRVTWAHYEQLKSEVRGLLEQHGVARFG